MIVKQRLWRTEDGRLVEDGHLEARVLAYTPGDEVPDAAAIELGLLPSPRRTKARARPADKQAAAAKNKADVGDVGDVGEAPADGDDTADGGDVGADSEV